MYDLVIIGAGPTGINCGIEATKNKLSYCILEKGVLANSIYHFPTNMTFFSTSKNLEIGDIPFISHSDKPTRKEALEYYRRLVEYYHLQIKFQQSVIQIDRIDNLFHITTFKENIKAKNIVLATGFYDSPRLLNVPGENLPKVKHYYDDPHPYIGMKVIVVGGANSACDVALETWNHGADVTMIVRRPALYQKVKYWILPNIQNRIKEGSIKAYFNTVIHSITADNVTIIQSGNKVKLENDYVLAMTGYKPDYTLIDQLGISYSNSADKIPSFDEASLETNIRGAYIAGVINGGMKTSSLFIENTRDHATKIVSHILAISAK